MNAKIKHALFRALKQEEPAKCLNAEARDIVEVSNEAAVYGFSELPQIKYCGCEVTPDGANISIQPQSGMMTIHELFLLKEAWGADDVNIFTDCSDSDGIELIFK